MRRNYFSIGAIMFAMGVGMGAFGAHGLEGKISTHYIDVWRKACEYWMYTSLGVMAVTAFVQNKEKEDDIASKIFGTWGILSWAIIGAGIFSISLWLLAMNELWGTSLRKLGMVTPIGGSIMIVAWILISKNIFSLNRNQD